MKKIVNISFTLALLAGTVVMISLTASKHSDLACREVLITLVKNDQNDLLTTEEISAMIPGEISEMQGKPCSEICLESIAEKVSSSSFVEDCDVCLTVNGVLKLSVRQRKPLLRLFNEYGDPYLVDVDGNVLPAKDMALDLTVASGYIPYRFRFIDEQFHELDRESEPLLYGLYELALALNEDRFLSSLIDQIYVNRQEEIELVPKVGQQIVVFGTFERMQEKLQDLKDTYTGILPAKGWETYRTINLKYENQVICSK